MASFSDWIMGAQHYWLGPENLGLGCIREATQATASKNSPALELQSNSETSQSFWQELFKLNPVVQIELQPQIAKS